MPPADTTQVRHTEYPSENPARFGSVIREPKGFLSIQTQLLTLPMPPSEGEMAKLINLPCCSEMKLQRVEDSVDAT
jgi:hypothetical protein